MSRYRILLADQLLAMGAQWPEGMSLAEQQEPGTVGTHWYLMDDPGAPDEIEGRDVDLRLRRGDDGQPEIAERRLILAHLCPQDGDEAALLACCGLPVFELPRGDRITGDKALVTCEGAPGGGESP